MELLNPWSKVLEKEMQITGINLSISRLPAKPKCSKGLKSTIYGRLWFLCNMNPKSPLWNDSNWF